MTRTATLAAMMKRIKKAFDRYVENALLRAIENKRETFRRLLGIEIRRGKV